MTTRHRLQALAGACLLTLTLTPAQAADDQEMVDTIFHTALAEGRTHQLLGELCSKHPHRLSGSPGGDAANLWAKRIMEERGLKVRLQELMVPYWERGDTMEVVARVEGGSETLTALALGGSVGTPAAGIETQVVEVKSLEEVETLGREAIEGKIVFFNRGVDQGSITHFAAYIGAADQRVAGASQAARFGAAATLVRSLSFRDDDYPHTGGMRYADDAPMIPAATLSVRAAERLSTLLAEQPDLRVSVRMNSRQLEERPAHNVVGELRGSDLADEYIVIGAHFDSWDVGEGAHDNGSGSMQAIEAVHLLQRLGYEFRRSIRVVMYANEEYLVGEPYRGGKVYAEEAQARGEVHYAGIETDSGAFTPRGFGFEGTDGQLAKVRSWLEYFDSYSNIHFIDDEGGGPDMWVLNELLGTPLFDMRTDTQRYLDFHHSANDTFDKVNRRELELGTAAMASLLYLVDSQGLD
jgi:cytochrome c5